MLVVADVLPDYRLIPTDGGNAVAPRPKAQAHKVAAAFTLHPGKMNGALTLDETNHLRYGIFGRNRDQHVHVVDHQMSFQHHAFLLGGSLPEHLAQIGT